MLTLGKYQKYDSNVVQKYNFLYKRFTERVKKYQNRGYGVNWIETDEIIPWVKNRFCYAEWLMN